MQRWNLSPAHIPRRSAPPAATRDNLWGRKKKKNTFFLILLLPRVLPEFVFDYRRVSEISHESRKLECTANSLCFSFCPRKRGSFFSCSLQRLLKPCGFHLSSALLKPRWFLFVFAAETAETVWVSLVICAVETSLVSYSCSLQRLLKPCGFHLSSALSKPRWFLIRVRCRDC